jgi:hypothetical protein
MQLKWSEKEKQVSIDPEFALPLMLLTSVDNRKPIFLKQKLFYFLPLFLFFDYLLFYRDF